MTPRGTWRDVALQLLHRLQQDGWAGHDPFDLLNSPWAAPLRPFRWPAVLWIQLGRRSPVDLRPLLGVPEHVNPKALALGLHATLDLAGAGDDTSGISLDLVAQILDAQTDTGGWGYPFPWANRHFSAPAGTPSGVVTAFAGHALLDAMDGGHTADFARAAVLEGARFLARDLNRIPERNGFLFSYTPLDRRGVHNASLLAASLLARASGFDGSDPEWAELARQAATATLSAQRDDGSWPYGASNRDSFVDSFHTGYVLSALRTIDVAIGLEGTRVAIEGGLAYWRETFLTGEGVAHRPGVPYPVDLHAVAQGILTCLEFRDTWDGGPAQARTLARWAIEHARRPDGLFLYLWHPSRPNRIPYIRWVQAWMLRALARLAAVEASG